MGSGREDSEPRFGEEAAGTVLRGPDSRTEVILLEEPKRWGALSSRKGCSPCKHLERVLETSGSP